MSIPPGLFRLYTIFQNLHIGSICFSHMQHNSWRNKHNKNLLSFVEQLPKEEHGRFHDSAFRVIEDKLYWLDLRGSQLCYLYNSYFNEIQLPSYKIPAKHFVRTRPFRHNCLATLDTAMGFEYDMLSKVMPSPGVVYPFDEDLSDPAYTPPELILSNGEVVPALSIPSFEDQTLEQKLEAFLSPTNTKTELIHYGEFSEEWCGMMEAKHPTLAFIRHKTYIQII